jgi:Domain of unknown function (DUF4234)
MSQSPAWQTPPGAPTGAPGYPGPYLPTVPSGYPPAGVGQIRPTGTCILLYVVTLGIYGWVWYYKVHDEMRNHARDGLGGGVALLLAILVGFVMPFLTASEIGGLYRKNGWLAPVEGVTGCWIFLPIAGPIVWFVKTNDAINAYWRAYGAVG